ncbi:hypothetical protein OXX69_004681 [Metschnikowia pulcherrima]
MSDTKRQKTEETTMRICTHSGSFHADESLAIYLLRLLPKFSHAQLVRSRNPTEWDASDIVVDVGGKYDGGHKWFDHHQREFNEYFSPQYQTKLSSAGLIYKHFGKDIIQEVLKLQKHSDVDMLYEKVYKEFIEAIDANDNGINNYPSDVEKKFNDRNLTLPSLVSQLNPRWNTNPVDKDFDEAFLKASELMGMAFLNLLKGYGESWLPARDIVETAFETRYNVHPSGEVLMLDNFCPWKEHLYAIEKENNAQGDIKFVLFQDSGASWRISTVSVTSSSFEFRFGLPEPWRGVRDEELSKVTGVEGCVFVHAAGFIGGCKTKEGVLELAKLALESRK